MLASLSHFGGQDSRAGEIKVGALALLTPSFRTHWLEEAVGEVFARQVFSEKWFLKPSGSWRSCDRLFPGIQSEDSCHPTPSAHCHLTIVPRLLAFFAQEFSPSLKEINTQRQRPPKHQVHFNTGLEEGTALWKSEQTSLEKSIPESYLWLSVLVQFKSSAILL